MSKCSTIASGKRSFFELFSSFLVEELNICGQRMTLVTVSVICFISAFLFAHMTERSVVFCLLSSHFCVLTRRNAFWMQNKESVNGHKKAPQNLDF